MRKNIADSARPEREVLQADNDAADEQWRRYRGQHISPADIAHTDTLLQDQFQIRNRGCIRRLEVILYKDPVTTRNAKNSSGQRNNINTAQRAPMR